MDPQKFGDSYDFVKSVPRQLFLPRIASLRNVTENRSPRVSWRIQPRNATLANAVGEIHRNALADLICPCVGPASSALLIPTMVRLRVIT